MKPAETYKCNFCGGENASLTWYASKLRQVTCPDCNAGGPALHSTDKAIQAWLKVSKAAEDLTIAQALVQKLFTENESLKQALSIVAVECDMCKRFVPRAEQSRVGDHDYCDKCYLAGFQKGLDHD